MFWAVGYDNGVIAKHAEFCGQEVEMVVPFEGVSSSEVYIYIHLLSKFVYVLVYKLLSKFNSLLLFVVFVLVDCAATSKGMALL